MVEHKAEARNQQNEPDLMAPMSANAVFDSLDRSRALQLFRRRVVCHIKLLHTNNKNFDRNYRFSTPRDSTPSRRQRSVPLAPQSSYRLVDTSRLCSSVITWRIVTELNGPFEWYLGFVHQVEFWAQPTRVVVHIRIHNIKTTSPRRMLHCRNISANIPQ